MRIFAISDLHLATEVPRKSMDIFGDHWADHPERIARAWKERIEPGDIVLIAGDISWAMKLHEAGPDLEFIARLPGRKVLIRGNHDYWWTSPSKIRAVLPDGMFILHHDALTLDNVALAGTRLWIDHQMPLLRLPLRDSIPPVPEVLRAAGEGPKEREEDPEQDEKIFQRELGRLKLALGRLDDSADLKICMVHYPPLSNDLKETRASRLIESARVQHCVFGHLHNLRPSPARSFFGAGRGVAYHLTSCDYLDFVPDLIAEW